MNKYVRGFTLIELLLVISIIGLMSTTMFAFVQSARARAINSNQQQTVRNVSTALASMIADKGVAPANYETVSGTIAWSNAPKTLDGNTKNAFDKSIDELIAGGYIKVAPQPARADLPIGYYNFGKGAVGAVMFAKLAPIGNWVGGGGGQPAVYGGNNTCQLDPSVMVIARTSSASVPGACPQGYRSYMEYTKDFSLKCYGSDPNPYVISGGAMVHGCAIFGYAANHIQCPSVCQGNVCYPGGGPDPVGTSAYSIPIDRYYNMENETSCSGDGTSTCRCNPL